ncbi:MAG: glycosyltransferase family 2 protein [Litorimonas sp.]
MSKKNMRIGRANTLPKRFMFRAISLLIIICLVALFVVDVALIELPVFNLRNLIFKLLTIMAWVSFIFSGFRLAACLSPKPKAFTPATLANDLPVYTVLVPLFNEANMVSGLMQALDAIIYPREKLQILLICEVIDPNTIAHVQRHMRAPFDLIIVPKGHPQTKPRALNYAVQYANGEFITIYDAEDRPHPLQLLTAITAFKTHPKWAALQAPLEYFNADQNWLTRQFSLEYAALFHVWLPWLARLKLPFPLGGTSNHMRARALHHIGGWDSYNVTEDADLSFRMAAYGFDIGYITPPTQEEAVSRLPDWHFQRARWIKGYIQTWQVHMRAPFLPRGIKGLRRFICLQLTLGMTLLSVWFYVPALMSMAVGAIWVLLTEQSLFAHPFYMISFIVSITTAILIGIIGAGRAGRPQLIKSALCMPAYWALLFPPTLRAAWELGRIPFHWHKTEHGVSSPSETRVPYPVLQSQRDPNDCID